MPAEPKPRGKKFVFGKRRTAQTGEKAADAVALPAENVGGKSCPDTSLQLDTSGQVKPKKAKPFVFGKRKLKSKPCKGPESLELEFEAVFEEDGTSDNGMVISTNNNVTEGGICHRSEGTAIVCRILEDILRGITRLESCCVKSEATEAVHSVLEDVLGRISSPVALCQEKQSTPLDVARSLLEDIFHNVVCPGESFETKENLIDTPEEKTETKEAAFGLELLSNTSNFDEALRTSLRDQSDRLFSTKNFDPG